MDGPDAEFGESETFSPVLLFLTQCFLIGAVRPLTSSLRFPATCTVNPYSPQVARVRSWVWAGPAVRLSLGGLGHVFQESPGETIVVWSIKWWRHVLYIVFRYHILLNVWRSSHGKSCCHITPDTALIINLAEVIRCHFILVWSFAITVLNLKGQQNKNRTGNLFIPPFTIFSICIPD